MTNRICESVYLVGGGDLSDPRDCMCYLVDLGELVLIDCGAGPGWGRIRDNIAAAGFEPEKIDTLVLTHCHVDHIGAANQVKALSNCKIVVHEDDLEAIETGDPGRTAANWYGMQLDRVDIDDEDIVEGASTNMAFSNGEIALIHTPGHTPGSMVAVVETPDNKRVLFGQDIHGPFDPAFGSDTEAWRKSMGNLVALDADILCEGHYGIYEGGAVREFIEEHLALNA
jgi:metallo-beta-lactamase class B